MNEDQELDTDFVPPTDGSWVPRNRANEMVDKEREKNTQIQGLYNTEREENIRLKEQLRTATEVKKPTQKPVLYTRAELNKGVEDNLISQAQADQIYDAQQEEKMDLRFKDLESEITQNVSTSTIVNMQYDEYLSLEPDLLVAGSDIHKKLKAEFNRLAVTFGVPKPNTPENTKMELAAMEGVCGKLDALRTVKKNDITYKNRETSEETESYGDTDLKDDAEGKIAKSVDKSTREYYRDMIKKGFYKNWTEVGEELKYANKRI